MTRPQGCDGLSARRRAVWWTFREPSLGRHVRRELLRNALFDFTTIIRATVCHQSNYFATYSRYKLARRITMLMSDPTSIRLPNLRLSALMPPCTAPCASLPPRPPSCRLLEEKDVRCDVDEHGIVRIAVRESDLADEIVAPETHRNEKLPKRSFGQVGEIRRRKRSSEVVD